VGVRLVRSSFLFGFPNSMGKKIFAYFAVGNVQHLADAVDLFGGKSRLTVEFGTQRTLIPTNFNGKFLLSVSTFFNPAKQFRVIVMHFASPFVTILI
jgi:hypothetical protein